MDGIKDGESNCDNDGDAGADEVDEEVGSEINFECVGGGEVEWLMLFGGFASWQTDRQTDRHGIGDCRVAFASENVCPDPRQPQRHY